MNVFEHERVAQATDWSKWTRMFVIVCGVMVITMILGTKEDVIGKHTVQRLVRIAELEIDGDQLPAYTAALKEEISTSVRVEPGVLTLYAVAVKDHPTQIRIFETYADRAAYESHLQTPHFKRYKTQTQGMVKSIKLVEAEPILLGAK